MEGLWKNRTTKGDILKGSLVDGREYGQERSKQNLLELQATERRQYIYSDV